MKYFNNKSDWPLQPEPWIKFSLSRRHTQCNVNKTRLWVIQIQPRVVSSGLHGSHLQYEDHAHDHGVHVVFAQLFAQSWTHGLQGLQILFENLLAHVTQNLWCVSIHIELHPASVRLLCHAKLLVTNLCDRERGEGTWKILQTLNQNTRKRMTLTLLTALLSIYSI